MLNTYYAHQIQWLIESRGWNNSIWGMKDKPLKLLGKKISFNIEEKSIFFFFSCESVLGLPAFRASMADSQKTPVLFKKFPEGLRGKVPLCRSFTRTWQELLFPMPMRDTLMDLLFGTTKITWPSSSGDCIPCTLLWAYKPTTYVVTEI